MAVDGTIDATLSATARGAAANCPLSAGPMVATAITAPVPFKNCLREISRLRLLIVPSQEHKTESTLQLGCRKEYSLGFSFTITVTSEPKTSSDEVNEDS